MIRTPFEHDNELCYRRNIASRSKREFATRHIDPRQDFSLVYVNQRERATQFGATSRYGPHFYLIPQKPALRIPHLGWPAKWGDRTT